jgi:hypothetical protein
MKTAHCKLNISKGDFDITWQHLEEALLHFKVEKSNISELKTVFYSVEGDIVKKNQPISVFHDSVNKTQNISSISKCPFQSKKPKQQPTKEDE